MERITRNWLKNLTLEQLIEARDQAKRTYNAYRNMTGHGAWIMWDGDKQDAAERQMIEANHEIATRANAEKNASHLIH